MNQLPPPVERGILDGFLALAILLGLFSENPIESCFALIQLWVLLKSYWRQGSPPVVLLLFLFPWLEISTGVFEANLRGETLNQMLHGTGQKAYWLSSIGLFAVHFGFFTKFKTSRQFTEEILAKVASKYSFERLVGLYFLIGPFSSFLGRFIGRGSSIYQVITYLNEVSVVLLFAICLRQVLLKQINWKFLAVIMFVTVLSFYSLFSSWKIVAFALFISLGTAVKLSRKLVIRIVFLSLVFGNLIFLWQGIKGEYRTFITGSENRGSLRSQAVVVGREQALNKFLELATEFYSEEQKNSADLVVGDELLYSTLRRAGYLEFFALVLKKVPEEIPHENGELLKESLSFALIPRFLNPNKGVKDDGAKVEKYTDFTVSETSSFSLGHYVEYFIDFKAIGMMVILFLYGLAGGVVYRFVLSRTFYNQAILFALPVAYVCLDKWGSFQVDTIYLYGQTFFGTICHAILFIPLYRVIERLAKP